MFNLSSLAFDVTSIFYIVIAILVLLSMVTIHELGHYIAGRILGFKIKEFAVGFGKVIWKKTNKRGEQISLRLFPLGGFCAFEGEEEFEGNEPAKEGTFHAEKPWKRIIVYIAGPMFNIISALFLAFIMLVSVGYDIPQINTINSVDYAGNSNLRAGDVVYFVEDQKVDFATGNGFTTLIAAYQEGESFTLKVKRDGEMIDVEVSLSQAVEDGTPITTEDGEPVLILGVTTSPYRHTVWEALVRVVPFTIGFAWLILKGIIMTFTFQVPLNSVSGPIGAIGIIAERTQASIANLFVLLPLLAVNLGVFNLLPIPALDGSHVVFTTIEWIRGKPINRVVETYIHFFGLMALLLFIVVLDILNFVS